MAKQDDTGLEKFQELFSSPDTEINQRRQDAIRTVRENDVASFPTDLSVLSAFDDVLACFALGGQIKNYYRYGTYSTCDAERKKFWFAVWNGSTTEKEMTVDKLAGDARELERRQKVQAYYKDILLQKKAEGSSEDVWQERKELLRQPYMESPSPETFNQ
ncbi:hypothetical protein FT663_02436 [Candidozyma haemuli var. vulneris]|uniref:Early meiotic induction protein 1 n=1 Tax=Candidozyma haemuli TaxID=45357 RepID=A0A2V1AMU2_9ASCO|nr:hypothetical protein CXQ85_001510 [[Candida] haemuloni]KAF3992119.1 hypothetical protein FT663_02436 [[Candida] haemuloni var. vulneris]KAF3992737.1 hypothetical protein FT662_00946 [[Candida] haemuloni var. vulneris]PVH19209.1 hypothetical protein CXQ85_001510 [[Candida] haemuloni]